MVTTLSVILNTTKVVFWVSFNYVKKTSLTLLMPPLHCKNRGQCYQYP
jgi:hypothetical protein